MSQEKKEALRVKFNGYDLQAMEAREFEERIKTFAKEDWLKFEESQVYLINPRYYTLKGKPIRK